MRPGLAAGWVALALAVQPAPPAQAAAAPSTGAAPAGAQPERASAAGAKPPARRRGIHSGIEGRVGTLTRALGLDAAQQARLRSVLLAQRQEMQRIWNEETVPAAERVAATEALSRTTADRIRGLLTEEQRKRYEPPPPAEPARASGETDVERWMTAGKPPEAP